ncbi:odorant receptor 131-2-like [Cheilinus undulatus]|uniref:odorant receptor 131-2-like n=1 Tax=Cheilinus undulatus TaxID=241271 RepID=UPI001BD67C9C|nr:odorant receptor 131-2-like [Cheilinus undulatus]
MSSAGQFQSNITVGISLPGRVALCIITSVPCCVFLYINATLLYVLRSKPVLRETPRYILLFNLLSADTVLMFLSQFLYILNACRIRLTYPVCGAVVMPTILTHEISPLILVVMSLERFVAVCHPFRHATIATIRNTGRAVILVWVFSSLNVLIQVTLMLQFPFKDLDTLQMTKLCSTYSILTLPISKLYEKVLKYFLLVVAAVVITSSYIGVVIAARSASTDKASAQKSRNTLLLHLVQLGLTLLSTLNSPMLTALSEVLTGVVVVLIQVVLYVFTVIFPRCLSSLIYGIRDQTIRPLLMYHLCFHIIFRRFFKG